MGNSTITTSRVSETYGWDTVYAMPVSKVNRLIMELGSSPAAMHYSDDEFEISAKFGDWQIVQGGDGKNIRMSLPLSNITGTIHSNQEPIKVGAAKAVIEVNLHYLEEDENSNKLNLMVKSTSTEEEDPVASLVACSFPTDPGLIIGAIVRSAVLSWCNGHLGEFDHVFASVEINEKIDSDAQWAFVKPSYTSYAYLDKDTLDDSLFAVLCMTGGRNGEHLSEQLSPNVIPDGSDAGYLISQRRFLNDMVKPQLGNNTYIEGLKSDDLSLSSDGTELNLSKPVNVTLKSTHGKSYSGKLTDFSIKAYGNTLRFAYRTSTRVDEFYIARCSGTHWYNIYLDRSANGQTLKYKQAQPPVADHSIEETKTGQVIEEVLEAVEVAALAVAAVLTDGAALAVAGLVIGLLQGTTMVADSAIKMANKDESPSIDMMVFNSTTPITWPDRSGFSLNSAGLNESLQLGGILSGGEA